MPAPNLSEQERLDWIRLARSPRIGPITFFQLIRKFGSAAAALKALPSLAGSGARLKPISPELIERELETTAKLGARLSCSCEAGFPTSLSWLDPPPPVITLKGQASLFEIPGVAIVGARNASAAGTKLARDLSAALGNSGFVIVSGLARGIDAAAHAAALKTGTVAVLAGGIDHIYPQGNTDLYHQISKEGVLVSENPPGFRATARDFPRRNRIVTGLSKGVVIIEAAERSGTLISARTAAEQGREVMAVPGSPLDPRAAGSNRLLRDGATLVRHADDVIEALNGLSLERISEPPGLFEHESGEPPQITENHLVSVETALSLTPMPVDEIARAAGMAAGLCKAVLMELELSGKALTFAGGSAALNPSAVDDF